MHPGTPAKSRACLHAIVGTVEQSRLRRHHRRAAGILTAVYLNEVGGRFTQAVRVVVTAMRALPAIVAGVFVYSFWISGSIFHFGYSGFAGALALAVHPPPHRDPRHGRGAQDRARRPPRGIDRARGPAVADGVVGGPADGQVGHLVTAVLLGIAVAIGETAPLLFTVFGAKALNWNLFHGAPGGLAPIDLHLGEVVASKDVALGYAAALVLFLMVFSSSSWPGSSASVWLGNRFRKLSNNVGWTGQHDLPRRKEVRSITATHSTTDVPASNGSAGNGLRGPRGRSSPAASARGSAAAWCSRKSLGMDRTRVTALIGPSGCGKSTFLRILNRMHETFRAHSWPEQ